jgi:hypothetical protein
MSKIEKRERREVERMERKRGWVQRCSSNINNPKRRGDQERGGEEGRAICGIHYEKLQ